MAIPSQIIVARWTSGLRNRILFYSFFTTDNRLSLPRPTFTHVLIIHLTIKDMNQTAPSPQQVAQVITPSGLLDHWQGHRSLTRRVIEAFPEEELFNYSIGGMRPFAEMALELLGIAAPGLREIVTGQSAPLSEHLDHGNSKANVLQAWDEATHEINALWPQLAMERFQETVKLFGQYESTVQWSVFYFIDNEIHHRGQGYVYLRSLGIEPPAFWDR